MSDQSKRENCENSTVNIENQLDIAQDMIYEEFSIFQMEEFLKLMKHEDIEEFLKFDRCYKLADKYLLSMVFVYFARTNLPLYDYTPTNFFVALYLAHDLEEDQDEPKRCLVEWVLGAPLSREDISMFLSWRYEMWKAMEFRAYVSMDSCYQVMVMFPDDLWERERDSAHGGAVRDYQLIENEMCRNCHFFDIKKRLYWI